MLCRNSSNAFDDDFADVIPLAHTFLLYHAMCPADYFIRDTPYEAYKHVTNWFAGFLDVEAEDALAQHKTRLACIQVTTVQNQLSPARFL